MAACFQLIKKGTEEPALLNSIDEELCAHFNVPVHPNDWYKNWYNTIGFRLALGKTFDEIKPELQKLAEEYPDSECPQLVLIVDYLQEHYESTNWSER